MTTSNGIGRSNSGQTFEKNVLHFLISDLSNVPKIPYPKSVLYDPSARY